DILPRMVRSPVDICFGTSPSQAPKSRPLENAAPLPIAATVALEMIGPMPGTVISRKLQALGHDARLMPAKYVRPYSKGQKNDFRDAEAIAEAVQRPTMRFVATKTGDQLDLQALHRVRERLVGQRTGVINQIRAFLLERGIAVRQGLRFLRIELPSILATRSDVLSPRMLSAPPQKRPEYFIADCLR